MKKTQLKWIAVDGSIYTVDKFKLQSETRVKQKNEDPILVEATIAFNIGTEVAEHIVRLHNERLT